MYTTEGIILKKTDYGETDALFTLYTRDFGKMRALAQGVKKEGAKLKGHLEPPNLCRVGFVLGKNGERLTHAEVMISWPVIRINFEKIHTALGMAERIDAHCFPGEKDAMLWEHIITYFTVLEKEAEIAGDFLHSFEKIFAYE